MPDDVILSRLVPRCAKRCNQRFCQI